jgi:preprotein translocase subunit SecE
VSDERAHDTEDRLERAEVAPEPERPAAVRRARTASRLDSPARSATVGKHAPTKARDETEVRAGTVARVIRFSHEVVAELRKVIWPSRRELMVYTAVVLVFVSFMVAFVALLDLGLGRAVLSVFG